MLSHHIGDASDCPASSAKRPACLIGSLDYVIAMCIGAVRFYGCGYVVLSMADTVLKGKVKPAVIAGSEPRALSKYAEDDGAD